MNAQEVAGILLEDDKMPKPDRKHWQNMVRNRDRIKKIAGMLRCQPDQIATETDKLLKNIETLKTKKNSLE